MQYGFFQDMEKGTKEAATAAGCEYVLVDQKSSESTMVSATQDLLNQGITALIISPIKPDAMGPIVDAAHAKGIPVVVNDIGGGGTNYDAIVISDNSKGGVLAADAMDKLIKAKAGASKNVASITCEPSAVYAARRNQGFETRIKELGYTVVASLSGNSKQEEGYKVMKDVLSANPDVAGVFSCNDPMAVGAAQAVADAGKSGSKDIFVIGFNADDIALQAIKAGQMAGHGSAGPLRDGQEDRRPGAPAEGRQDADLRQSRRAGDLRSGQPHRREQRRHPDQVAGTPAAAGQDKVRRRSHPAASLERYRRGARRGARVTAGGLGPVRWSLAGQRGGDRAARHGAPVRSNRRRSAVMTDPTPSADDLLVEFRRRRPRVGLVSGGLGTYWPQFPDLLPQLQESARYVAGRLEQLEAQVVDVGFISDAQEGAVAAETLRQADCDLIVLFLTTYLTSSMVLPIAQRSGAPVLVIDLQPTESMDHATFDTGQWLAYCGQCSVPEVGNVFRRGGIEFRSVSGHLRSERAWARIDRWVRAAGVRSRLRNARHGLMGHLYPGMLDVSTDLTLCPPSSAGTSRSWSSTTSGCASPRSPTTRSPTGSRSPASCSTSTTRSTAPTWTGPCACPWAWTAWSRTSTWTPSPTTTAAWRANSTNGSAPG